MHKFLKAIGFSDIKRKDLGFVLQNIIEHPDIMKVTKDSEGNKFAELSKEFAENIGISIRGIYEDDNSFQMEYYYPYFIGSEDTTQEQIEIEKHSEKESYAGVCDELKIGVTLIFYLQNVADYLSEQRTDGNILNLNGAMLAALSTEGKILLPIEKKEKKEECIDNKYFEHYQLIAKAREGNEDAIESLTLEDMDMYSLISRRIMNEDVLSIVSSYFMPYGIESDQYSILADIEDYHLVRNKFTKEEIYCLKVDCNDMIFNVCINRKDLLGEPEIGRRFKGNIWMQGRVYL